MVHGIRYINGKTWDFGDTPETFLTALEKMAVSRGVLEIDYADNTKPAVFEWIGGEPASFVKAAIERLK